MASLDRLRCEIIEPLILFLVTRDGRTPFHAAAISDGDGLAVLLVGPSGAGKSSLALAAHEAGWTVLSEDTAYIQIDPSLRVWGWPGPVHLLPGNKAARGHPLRLRNGRLKHAVPLAQSSEPPRSFEQAVVCILERGTDVGLTRLTSTEAKNLMPQTEAGFRLLDADIQVAMDRLVKVGALKLTLSADPAEAIALLDANLGEIRKIFGGAPA
ncbi:MAG TPA: hypothetical protein VLM18_07550 [Croceibacterium sp.]|nr:hypothetical protein [Croceibacterium sp.]